MPPSADTPSAEGILTRSTSEAVADVVISGARQVDAVAHEWAIIVDAVGCSKWLELDLSNRPCHLGLGYRRMPWWLPQKTFTAGANFGGYLRRRQVKSILRVP